MGTSGVMAWFQQSITSAVALESEEKKREIKNANKIFHNCNLQNISIFWGGENTGGASFKEIYANHI